MFKKRELDRNQYIEFLKVNLGEAEQSVVDRKTPKVSKCF